MPVAMQALVALPVMLLAGCPSDEPTPKPDAEARSSKRAGPSRAERRLACESLLGGTLESLAPGTFLAETDIDTEVRDLEIWRKTCGGAVIEGGVDAVLADAAAIDQTLPPERAEMARGESYTRRDARHIVDSLLAREIVAASASRAEFAGDVEAVEAIIDVVTRETAVLPAIGTGLPTSQQDIWIQGFASPSDQMWLLMSLARQRRLDAAVILIPVREGQLYELLGIATGPDPTPESVLLFDPQIGYGMPSIANPGQTATLAEGLADDAVFRAFDLVGQEYPVSSERLKNRIVRFAAEPSLLAPRMGLLQLALPSEWEVELFESIGPSAIAETGLPARLAAAFDVPPERVAPWPHSIYQQNRSDPPQELGPLLLQQSLALTGPVRVVVEDGQPKIDSDERGMRVGRIAHLTGNVREAVGLYLKPQVALVKSPNAQPLPPTVEQQITVVNTLAAINGRYWTALTQIAQDQPESAASKLEAFLQRDIQTFWARPASIVLAKLLAEQGDTDAARDRMATVPGKSPGDLYLLKQWGGQVPTTEEVRQAQAEQAAKMQAELQKRLSGDSVGAGGAKPSGGAMSKESDDEGDEAKGDEADADEVEKEDADAKETDASVMSKDDDESAKADAGSDKEPAVVEEKAETDATDERPTSEEPAAASDDDGDASAESASSDDGAES